MRVLSEEEQLALEAFKKYVGFAGMCVFNEFLQRKESAPGSLLRKLSDEERDALKHLSSDLIEDRIRFV